MVMKDMSLEKQRSFERFQKLVGDDGLQTLNNKSVFILGIGGVGSYVCEALARSGVGHLILMDGDVVDESNINRQILALHSTVGRKKVQVMKERILDINPLCNVQVIDSFLDLDLAILNNYEFDFFIDCCDTVKVKEALLTYFNKKDNFLCCLGTAKKLDPSLLEVTQLDKTYNDPLARILRKYVKDNHLSEKVKVLFSSELPISCEGLGSSAFVPSSAGLLIASYVVRYFLQNKKK